LKNTPINNYFFLDSSFDKSYISNYQMSGSKQLTPTGDNTMSTKKALEEKGKNLVKDQSTKMLCEMFITTNGKTDLEVPMIRGWIMDELELRDQVAFDDWIDTEDVALIDNPTSFFIKK
jgi:hypothetical protein